MYVLIGQAAVLFFTQHCQLYKKPGIFSITVDSPSRQPPLPTPKLRLPTLVSRESLTAVASAITHLRHPWFRLLGHDNSNL